MRKTKTQVEDEALAAKIAEHSERWEDLTARDDSFWRTLDMQERLDDPPETDAEQVNRSRADFCMGFLVGAGFDLDDALELAGSEDFPI